MKIFARLSLAALLAMQANLILPAFAADNKATPPQEAKLTLPSGTKLQVELSEDLSSNKAKKDQEVIFYATKDIKSEDGRVLIKKGARATGKVTEAKGAGTFGRKGKLEFTVEEVKAIDDSQVPLRSSESKSGKGRGATMVALTLFVSVLGVFVKGKNVQVPKGSKFDVYVDDDVKIASAQP